MKTVNKIIYKNKEYVSLYLGSTKMYEKKQEVLYDCLTFEALEPSTILYKPSTVSTAQYSYDTVNWETADNVTLNLNTGDKVYFKGNITGNQSLSNRARFNMTGKVAASGSIMSLQAGNPQDKSLNYDYEFVDLFYNCKSLVTAPELSATELKFKCFHYTFDGCSNLKYIKAMFTTTPSSTYTQNWVNGVASTGTFVKNKDATWDVTSVNGIPTGWTVETA